jgi:hypothetical protein
MMKVRMQFYNDCVRYVIYGSRSICHGDSHIISNPIVIVFHAGSESRCVCSLGNRTLQSRKTVCHVCCRPYYIGVNYGILLVRITVCYGMWGGDSVTCAMICDELVWRVLWYMVG